MSGTARPGSEGEHDLQERFGTAKRANAFYDNQVLDHLTPEMREFMSKQKMAFIATSDAHGECDSSFRAGPPGFIRVIDEKTVMWPEYKGNGVMASMGNISENPNVGLLMVDFFETAVGLHVNGKATIVDNVAVAAFAPLFDRIEFSTEMPEIPEVKKTPERWVVVDVEEAYIHCSKHIPMLQYAAPDAEAGRRAGDVFKAKNAERAWLGTEVACEVEPQIGQATIAAAEPEPEPVPAPTFAPSGRRLPLPARR